MLAPNKGADSKKHQKGVEQHVAVVDVDGCRNGNKKCCVENLSASVFVVLNGGDKIQGKNDEKISNQKRGVDEVERGKTENTIKQTGNVDVEIDQIHAVEQTADQHGIERNKYTVNRQNYLIINSFCCEFNR